MEALNISSAQTRGVHPYPTPPVSKPPSLKKEEIDGPPSKLGRDVEDRRRGVSYSASSSSASHRRILSQSLPAKARRASMLFPLSAVVTVSNAHVTQFSTPPDTAPTSPLHFTSV